MRALPRVALLLLVLLVALPAIEPGTDPLLDKAIADQFPAPVRKLAYAVLTDYQKRDAATPAEIFREVGIKPGAMFDDLRWQIIRGEVSVQDIQDLYHLSSLPPAERDAELDRQVEALRQRMQRSGDGSGSK